MIGLSLYTEKVAKLFYGTHPYKIAYKRLYGFPDKDSLFFKRHFESNPNAINEWWFDMPSTDEEKSVRVNCYNFLRKFKDIKFNNGAHTHAYFKYKSDYEEARNRYVDLHKSYAEPIVENLKEVLDSFDRRVELKNNLWFKTYKYKIVFKPNRDFIDHTGHDLYKMYAHNTNYRLNSNMKRYDPVYLRTHQKKRHIHHQYQLYAIYCLDKIDADLLTFVASECIGTITKAVLLSDLDK
ncbi:MAG: hypothetical protein CMD92_08340 [Gammaproteobacteria bacterium]|nr:hypothetical protein [Gammaproteobacteria bacterium]|tara:strand:+ start:1918 stop:2631 length:714 start_codon:yes stop_codon:yes gene_type:complete